MWCEALLTVLLAANLVQSAVPKNEAGLLKTYAEDENPTALFEFYKNTTLDAIHRHDKILVDMIEPLVQKANETVELKMAKFTVPANGFRMVLETLQDEATPEGLRNCIYRTQGTILNLLDTVGRDLVLNKEQKVLASKGMINARREPTTYFLGRVEEISQEYSKCESFDCEYNLIMSWKGESAAICRTLINIQNEAKAYIQERYSEFVLYAETRIEGAVSSAISTLQSIDKCIHEFRGM